MSYSQHDNQTLELEVNRLRAEVARFQAREVNHKQIEEKLSNTLENLTIHQEELRTQNEELRRAQASLEESTRRYRDLFDQAPVGYFILDDQGTIHQVNKKGADILGYTSNYLKHKPFLLYLTHSSRKTFSAHLRRISGKIHSSSTEVECVHTNGKTIPTRIESVLTHESSRFQRLFRTTVIDLTDRKKAEAILLHSERQLRQAFKMEAIGTLAGGIAHDFNNILSAIIGYSQLAMTQLPSESPVCRHLDEVLTAGFRAKDLVGQILAFSRQTEPEKQIVDLKYLVRESIRLLRATLPRTIHIKTQFAEEEDLCVVANPTEFHQVIINLCTNAEYAMREKGGTLVIQLDRVEISADFAKAHPPLKPIPYLYLSIQDTGLGIPPKIQPRIFDPFFTTKEIGEGTGMGLAVAHGIVAHHGGLIMLERTSPEGTRFGIYLPWTSKPACEPTHARPTAPRKSGRILFIDDEDSLARMGEQILQQLGYAVVTCTSGAQGIEIFEADPNAFDVVVLDQTMPVITGETVARRLLSLRPNLPVILCTGFSHVMTQERALSIGISAFLMKPLLSHELDRVIQDLLSQHHDTPSNP